MLGFQPKFKFVSQYDGPLPIGINFCWDPTLIFSNVFSFQFKKDCGVEKESERKMKWRKVPVLFDGGETRGK